MPPASVEEIVEILGKVPFLDPKQMEEVTGNLQLRFTEPRALLDELVRRRWLTGFQRERLLDGQAVELQLGPYLISDRLGMGGMGEVFKARHQILDRVVALKITRKEVLKDPRNQQRFLREIQTTARLSHPNIVTAHDAARVGDIHFFAMEYVEGTDLGKLVRETGSLPVTRACDYIRQAALGLQHAYEQGLVHRDIKPSNLLVTADGSQVKISDMGLVRLDAGEEEGGLTETGAVIGTPDYLAPEQAVNSRAVDIRADLYSLGCTFYYLLTGRPPFPAGTPLEKLFKHVQDKPPPVRELRPEIPTAVQAVVEKLLAKKPEDRYQQPAQLAQVLEPLCRASAEPAAPPTSELWPFSLVGLAPPAGPGGPAKEGKEVPAGAAGQPPAAKEKDQPPAPAVPAPAPAAPAPAASAPRPAPEAGKPPRWKKRAALAAVVLLLSVGTTVWRPWTTGADRSRKASVGNSIGMRLVWVGGDPGTGPAPGSEPQGPEGQGRPARPFFIALRETTADNFQEFVRATRYLTEAEKNEAGALRWDERKGDWERDPKCTWRHPGRPLADADPVVCVSRYDALSFCYWLSRKEGKVYRLPTDAAWELASRSGATRQAKAAGVWEWCVDDLGTAASLAESGRAVLRGGPRTSDRDGPPGGRIGLPAGTRRNDVGFRVVLEAGVP
jgi:serine/threonine protein kinase